MSKSIAERIEALEGACREMDAEIAVTVLGMERDGDYFFGKDEDFVLERDYYSLDGAARELPHYTSSIDSAMTLVPEGWDAEISIPREGHPTNPKPVGRCFKGTSPLYFAREAAPPALALCAAALRAQEAHNG